MSTPLYDALVAKVRDWSNKKELATIPNSVIQDCLTYGADDCYRLLRIPPLEQTTQYTISSGDFPTYDKRITNVTIPTDLTEFIYIRNLSALPPRMYGQIADSRTLLDDYAEKYNIFSWAWKGNTVQLAPRLTAGDIIEIQYYRRLAPLNATYSVVPVNYLTAYSDAAQPFLTLDTAGTTLWKVTVATVVTVFATQTEADAFIVLNPTGVKTSAVFSGKEAPNWLRDGNERLLIWSALAHAGAYLFDEAMENRYTKKVADNIEQLNKEEKMRRARGGNVQINVNGGGLI